MSEDKALSLGYIPKAYIRYSGGTFVTTSTLNNTIFGLRDFVYVALDPKDQLLLGYVQFLFSSDGIHKITVALHMLPLSYWTVLV